VEVVMSRVKIIIFLSIFLIYAGPTYPQNHPDSIYGEFLGSGGIYSINYDRLFTPNIGARIGFSYLSFERDIIIPETTMYFFPISFNYYAGDGNSKLELGAGMTVVTGTVDWFGMKEYGSVVVGNFNIGYRYEPIDGGFFFRIGFTPFVTAEGIQPWGGLGIGATF
jgi:hypothetical protein